MIKLLAIVLLGLACWRIAWFGFSIAFEEDFKPERDDPNQPESAYRLPTWLFFLVQALAGAFVWFPTIPFPGWFYEGVVIVVVISTMMTRAHGKPERRASSARFAKRFIDAWRDPERIAKLPEGLGAREAVHFLGSLWTATRESFRTPTPPPAVEEGESV